MPRQTIVQLTDDYSGEALPEDTAPVSLSMGGTTYNLYLSEKSHGALLEALSPFIEGADEVSGTARGTSGRAKPVDADKKNARAWAIESGFEYAGADGKQKTLGIKGRIPTSVIEAWRAAGSPKFPSTD
jgi:hypothetical protein